MKTLRYYLIVIGLITFMLLLYKTCTKKPLVRPIKITEEYKKREQLREFLIDSMLKAEKDTLIIIQTETFTKVKERFITVYGETDTVYQPTIVIDSSQAVKCMVCEVMLKSRTVELFIVKAGKSDCDSTLHFVDEENKLWRKRYNTKWFRWGKRKRIIRKINKLNKNI